MSRDLHQKDARSAAACFRRVAMGAVLGAMAIMSVAPEPAAAAYPERPVTVIVPYGPGGTTDILARVLSEPLSAALGVPIVVENRPGANSRIGTARVAKSSADGYTLGLVIGAFANNATLYAGKLPYDTLNDFVPVSHVASAPFVLVANRDFPASNVAELIEHAKHHPGAVTFGSSGTGASSHLSMEYIKALAGVDMLHVPYSGGAAALTDIMAQNVNLLFDTLPTVKPYLDAKSLKAIGYAGSQPASVAPEIPVIAQSGLPGFEVGLWAVMLAPKGTPPEVVQRLSAEIATVVQSPTVKDRLVGLGFDPVGSNAAQAERFVHDEIHKWAEIIRQAGVKVND